MTFLLGFDKILSRNGRSASDEDMYQRANLCTVSFFISDITFHYAILRDIIFTFSEGVGQNYIEAVNFRTEEYYQISNKNYIYSDFIYTCECFTKEHFGKHLIHYVRKSYQK